MPPRIVWTPEMDATILRMRGERASWDAITEVIGHTRWSVIERGNRLGAVRELGPAPVDEGPDLSRDPYPPGHPMTWGAITAGTCLDGAAYRWWP